MKATRRRFLRWCGAGTAAGALTGIYAFGIEPLWLREVVVEVPIEGLDPAFSGFTIAQLSDLHVGAGVPADYLRDAVQRIITRKPDLIALTGDFIHRGGAPGAAARVLEGLADVAPALAVLGNHDGEVRTPSAHFHSGLAGRVAGALRSVGVTVLENETRTVTRGGATLTFAGFGDLWSGRFWPDRVSMAAGPTVALTHNPDTAPDLARAGASLILAGHTHGGQVAIPFMGPPLLPVRLRQYSAGLYRVGASRLYVNRGVGWLRRVRLFVRPEITYVVLQST